MKAQTLSYIFLNFSILSYIFLNIHLYRAFGSNCRILFLQYAYLHYQPMLSMFLSFFIFMLSPCIINSLLSPHFINPLLLSPPYHLILSSHVMNPVILDCQLSFLLFLKKFSPRLFKPLR
jgi:hypothetical protein